MGGGGLPFCLAGTSFNLKVFLSDLCLISAGPLKRFRQWKLYAQSVLMSFYCSFLDSFLSSFLDHQVFSLLLSGAMHVAANHRVVRLSG